MEVKSSFVNLPGTSDCLFYGLWPYAQGVTHKGSISFSDGNSGKAMGVRNCNDLDRKIN
jgi:hypothetical protein